MTQHGEPFRGFARPSTGGPLDRGTALLDVAAVRAARAHCAPASASTGELPTVSARAAAAIAGATVSWTRDVSSAPAPVEAPVLVPALDVPSVWDAPSEATPAEEAPGSPVVGDTADESIETQAEELLGAAGATGAEARASVIPATRAPRRSADTPVSSFVEHFEAFAASASSAEPEPGPETPESATVVASQAWGATTPQNAPQTPSNASDDLVEEASGFAWVEMAAPEHGPSPFDGNGPSERRHAAEQTESEPIVLEEPVLASSAEIIRPRRMHALSDQVATTTAPSVTEAADDASEERAKASDPATAGQDLMALATHRTAAVRAAVAARPDLPATVVIFLSRDHSSDVLAALLTNMRVPASTVRFLADHRDPRIADLAVQRLRNEFR